MIEFKYETPEGERVITYQTDTETLGDVLEDFTNFLRAIGYYIDGYLDVVNDDQPDVDDGLTDEVTDCDRK